MKRPNVVLILADDMGYGDLGALSDGGARTPALDQLMHEGMLFTQHYSCSPVCAPARAGLMTGRYPHRTGCIDTLDLRGLDRLALGETTMADLFHNAGYATGMIGKWHLGSGSAEYHPNARGFDEFVGFSGGWSDFYDYQLDYNGQKKRSSGRYMTEVLTDEAVQFIQRHHNEPFFLHLCYNAPHWPLQCPDEDVKPFRETGKFSEEVSTIYGMIYNLDRGIARVLEALRQHGLEENTIVVFTSDNGPDFDSGGQYWGQPNVRTERYNAGFKGHKYLVYEGGIRVPAILRWPAGLNSAKQSHHLWHFTDWLPTLLAAAGIEQPKHLQLDGQNLLPLLQGSDASAARSAEQTRFWQWNRYTPLVTCNAAMREGDWKLVRPSIDKAMEVLPIDVEMDRQSKTSSGGSLSLMHEPLPVIEIAEPAPLQLFNLKEDPYEQINVAAHYPEKTANMLKQLEKWYISVEEDRRALRS